MKIITCQLAQKLPSGNKLLLNQIVDPLDFFFLKSILSGIQKLTIYDATHNQSLKQFDIVCVGDHINRTGKNPLISYQKELDIDFIDITNLYKKEEKHIITDCCGKKLNKRYPFPSHFLCHISILAKAMKIKKIKAHVINIL